MRPRSPTVSRADSQERSMGSKSAADSRRHSIARDLAVVVVSLILGLLVGSPPGGAQPVKRIATVVLIGDDAVSGPLPSDWRDAFREGLKDLGWVEGSNLRLEQRSATTRELRPE